MGNRDEGSPIVFGIVGCGRIAHRHAEHIIGNPATQLRVVYDVKAERSNSFATQYRAEAARSLAELLSHQEIDIVSICTPNGDHCQSAMQSLLSDRHVLVEKPMALRRRDCERMIDTALKRNRQLFVVKQNRFNPPVSALKQLVDSGELGRVFLVAVNCFWNREARYYDESDWKGSLALDGGTLFTQFSHFVDVMYHCFGDIGDIQGRVTNAHHEGQIEFEDTGVFSFRFLDGGLGSLTYTTTCFKENMEGSLTVFAENATIKVGGQYLNVVEYQSTRGSGIAVPEIDRRPNDYGHYKGSMSNHDLVIANVVDALRGRSSIKTSALEGMKVVEIIERMYSAARRAPVEI